MVDQMTATHDIRADMVFVTGLSAGGFETLVMLADYPDVFAAGASVAVSLPLASCASMAATKPSPPDAPRRCAISPSAKGPGADTTGTPAARYS